MSHYGGKTMTKITGKELLETFMEMELPIMTDKNYSYEYTAYLIAKMIQDAAVLAQKKKEHS